MAISHDIEKAHNRIEQHILKTPLFPSSYLSELNNGEVFLKLESEQYTGSFKARGALNKVLSMSAEEKVTGMITASTGNHAQGFARALSISGDSGSIFLPENANPAKVEALRSYTAKLEFFGDNCLDTELHAKAMARERGMAWVSPYNDYEVICGQGTIGKEITETLDHVDVVLACIGGGGMISGVAGWFKDRSPNTEIIGCLPERSAEMKLSVEAGHVIVLDDPEDTLSDGSAGGLEIDSITFAMCQNTVDSYETATEEEIAEGIRFMVDKHHKIIEGAAGVAIACYKKLADQLTGKRVVIVICGSNINSDKLKQLI